MSLIPGGRADKFGNRFERHWVVSLALDVIDGRRLTSIKWEPLGGEGEGIECVAMDRDKIIIYYQCKIQNGNKGGWSMADLKNRNVLQAAKTHLQRDASSRFCFVSDDPARALKDMAGHARHCDFDIEDFLGCCNNSNESKKDLQTLFECWRLDRADHKHLGLAIGMLSRIDVVNGCNGDEEEQQLHRIAEALVQGDGAEVVGLLGDELEKKIGNTFHSDQLLAILQSRHFLPRNLGQNPNLPAAIKKLQEQFRDALETNLIDGEMISRPEPEQLCGLACEPGQAKLIFVTGEVGAGKSGVILQVVKLLGQREVPFLPLRLDTDYPHSNVQKYSRDDLNLPGSPSDCLRALAGERRAVLLVDQLDAIRWTSRNSDKAWEICKEILDAALRIHEMTVIVVGRTIDFEEDPKIKSWREKKKDSRDVSVDTFLVGTLPEEKVAALLEIYGLSYSTLQPKEKDLLRNCQHLRLWIDLAKDRIVKVFSSRARLLQKAWEYYRDRALREDAISEIDMNECLSHLVGYMERQGRLYAPPSLMSPHASSKATLLRFGLICEDRRWIRFSHQSHLDYLIVEQILNQTLQRDQEPIDWLRKSPQTLVRRDQVRLLLQLLREEEPLIYSTFLGQIFAGEDIRFHLQHLALTTLGHAQIPSPDEIQLVKTLWSQEAWRRHVLELVLMGHRPWLECLTTDQTLPTLLDMQPDEERNQMLRLCKGSALAAPVWFEQILSPCWNSADPEWREIIARLLPYEADHETDAVFGWHLELARQGMNIDIHDMGFFFVDRLSKTHPGRAFAMLAAVVEGCIQHCRRMIGESGQRRIELDLSEYSHLEEACKRDCCSSWEQIIPAFRNAISFVDELVKGGHISRADVTKDSALNLVSFLHQLLVLSGAGRLRSEGMAFMDQLEAFLPPPASAPWSRLVVDILASAPADLADRAICFFLQMESPFDIKSESTQMEFRSKHCLSAQEPAKSLLQNLADHCSHDVFALLESAVLSFHPKRETKTIEWQLEEIREKCWLGTKPNHYGLAQYDLLLALPPDKLSDHGKTALRTWRYKFGDLQKHLNSSRLQIYTLVPVIPEQRARFISDSEWIKIVYGLQIKDRDSHRENDMTFSKASQDEFARTLQVAAASNPSRYICLGLHFPANSPGCYFESLLRAAAITVQPEDATAEWMPASTADVERLIHHIDDKMNREVARAITHLIDKRASESWSQSTLDLIKTLALNHPDPAQGSEFEATEECVDLQSLESVIFNSVRCTAISAVAQLLWHHPELLAWSKILAEEALCDSSPAVLAATLGLAFAIGKYELEWAACFVRRACAATPLPIVSTHYGQNLMQYVWSLETEMAPVLKASLASDSKGAVKQAGFWVTIGSFKKGIYEELAVQAASGAPEARAGVVDALKVLINNSNSNCSKYLQRVSGFLDDHDVEVLEAVGRIMASDRFLDSPEAPAFAIQFAKSRAFLVDPSSLLYNLSGYEGSLLTFHEAIAASIAHFSDSVADAGGGLKGRQWYIELELSKLLLRLYSQAEDDLEVRSQCLDSWDMLLRTGSLNPGDLLSRIDAS